MNAVVDPGHRVTVQEYEQICAANDLGRVELIDGVIYELSPESCDHEDGAFTLLQLLLERYPEMRVRPGGSVQLSGQSMLQPDVYVANPRRYPVENKYTEAADVHIVVEVALTTWAKDVGLKMSAYARAGIPEYWVVDPRRGGKIVRHTRPEDGTYISTRTVPLADGLDSIAEAFTALTD
jgi:Uma2 family endonuclease